MAKVKFDHDEFNCECHETCSWCATSVLDSSLREQPDGARICSDCARQARTARAFAQIDRDDEARSGSWA